MEERGLYWMDCNMSFARAARMTSAEMVATAERQMKSQPRGLLTNAMESNIFWISSWLKFLTDSQISKTPTPMKRVVFNMSVINFFLFSIRIEGLKIQAAKINKKLYFCAFNFKRL